MMARTAIGVRPIGGMPLLLRHGNAVTNFQTFLGEPTSLRLVPQIVTRAFQGQALALVQFGLCDAGDPRAVRRDRICVRTGLAICGRGGDRAGGIGFEPIGHKL